MRRVLLPLATAIALMTTAAPALAYRPFDGTDADVAALGDFELELGPVHWYSQGDSHYLLAPATVLNLGFLPRWELVIDFQNYVGIDQPPGEAQVRLLDTDILVKHVLLAGALQDQGTGPSVAAEFGPLVPNVNGEEAFGASLDVITSMRWNSWMTLHLNSWLELSRGDLKPDYFEGLIVEGDVEASVRPVSEWYVSYDFGSSQTTVSGLVGGIWKAGDDLDLDMAFREASVGGVRATEIRLGLTWTLGVWTPAEEKGHGANGHRWLAMAR
jgi:hypothetical protein